MKRILSIVLLSVVMFGCKKDNDAPKTPTKENLVGTWKQTSETVNGQNTWNSPNYEPCEMDDTYVLLSDNKYNYNDVGITCSPNGSYTGGTWSITGTTFNMDGMNWTVSDFTGTSMKLSASMTFGGIPINVVMTWNKQ